MTIPENITIEEVSDYDHNGAGHTMALAALNLMEREIYRFDDDIKWANGYLDELCGEVEEYGQDAARLFIAKSDDEIVGAIELNILDESTGNISHLAVDDGWQRRGIGSYLLRHAESLAQSKGVKKMETGGFGYEYTSGFYKKHGYEITELNEGDFEAVKMLSND